MINACNATPCSCFSTTNPTTYNLVSGLSTGSYHTLKISRYLKRGSGLANRSRGESGGRASEESEDSNGLHGGGNSI